MHLIKTKGQKVALKFSSNDIKEGLSFLSDDKDFIQVGIWKYKKHKKLLAHTHNIFKREVDRTQEFIYVLKGCLRACIYNEKGRLLEELTLNPNEGLILFSGGHGYEILEDDTAVVEVKNGPYAGAELDRRRLNHEK